MHGQPKNTSWCGLSRTVTSGDIYLELDNAVDWDVGSGIVISSTGYDPTHGETAVIANISSTGKGITLMKPLKYEHIGR